MPQWLKLSILLCLVWLFALGADALSLDWLLLVAVWGGLSAVLPAGRTLLDRLVLGALFGLGVLAPVGVLLSLWPFGLRPALIGGIALTGLVAVGVLGDRWLRLPAPRWADVLPVIATTVIVIAVSLPYLMADGFTGRLAALMSGEDSTRHAALVDYIRATGGYGFLAVDRDDPILMLNMFRYPQGWHFGAAVVENFLRSSIELGDARAGLTYLMALMLGTFGLLVLTVLWAAGYVLGRNPSSIGYAATVLVAGWLSVNSELVRTVVHGFPAEMLGLTFIAGLVAIVARPVAKVRLQIILLVTMTVGVGFAYYLLLPPALLMVLWAVYADRRRMRTVPRWVALGVLASGVAFLPAVIGVLSGRQDKIITYGRLGATNLIDILLFLGLVGIGLLMRRHDPVWRRFAGPVAAATGAVVAINLYSRLVGDQPAYYYGKMLHLIVVVLIVGVGVVGALVTPMLMRLPRRLGIIAAVLAGVLLVGSQAVMGRPTLTAVPWFSTQLSGRYAEPERAHVVVSIDDACPAIPGLPTAVFYGANGKEYGYFESSFLGPLQHRSGETARVTYGLPWASAESRLRAIVTRAGGPVRVIVGDKEAKGAIAKLHRLRPDLAVRLTVVDLDRILGSGRCDEVRLDSFR